MRKRIQKKSQLILRVSFKENERPITKMLETHYEKLSIAQKYVELREIVNFYDPVFLLWIAGEDEYDLEIDMINERLYTYMNRNEVYELVCKVFVRMFGVSCDDDTLLGDKVMYEEMAKDIYNWMLFGPRRE